MNQNKRIAEFMGMKPHHQDSGCLIRVDDNGSNEVVPIEELAYHTSWDWLMPVVQKCFYGTAVQVDDNKDNFFTIKNSLPYMDATYKAVVEFIERLSVEPNAEAIDEAFFAGFCHALEYAKREIENADDIDVEIDEYAGDLTISGTINIDLGQHLDADNMIDDIMRKYERDTTKDGTPNTQDK